MLRTACAEAATWTQPLTVAVNVSAVQIHNANFAHLGARDPRSRPGCRRAAWSSRSPRRRSSAISTARWRRSGSIKTLGVRIAMDDFGTGYSSLSNLRAFPFDKIKIDGSFIKSVNVNDQAAAIVRAVLGLGRALGLPVLAEGVETAASSQFLSARLLQRGAGLSARPAERHPATAAPHARRRRREPGAGRIAEAKRLTG